MGGTGQSAGGEGPAKVSFLKSDVYCIFIYVTFLIQFSEVFFFSVDDVVFVTVLAKNG